MPLPVIPKPKFPNVPPFAGVPPLVRKAGAQLVTSIVGGGALGQLLQDVLGLTVGPQWGVFAQDGTPVIVGDSTISFDFTKDNRISDFPVAPGSFSSYNKVDVPFDVKMMFATTKRSDFLLALEPQLLSLELYTAVTPDKSYTNANIVHYNYRRTVDNGVSLLMVDVWLKEVRETAQTEFTQTKEPSGEATKSNSTVQAAPVAPIVAQERALKTSGDIRRA